MGKNVIVGSKSREKMKEGVDILADAVKATLGPRGRHAAIERKSGPPIITKDGVTVARYIDLSDRIQNMGAQLIKSVASEANSEAGDGTTTATVLAQEIYGRGLNYVAYNNNPVLLKRGIDLATSHVVEALNNISIQVSDEESLRHVATISANNDFFLGKLIAEAVTVVGEDGLITVEESSGNLTEVQYLDGFKLDKGWMSEDFITNTSKSSCDFTDPYILVYDEDIKSVQELVNILNLVIEKGRQILIIARNIEKEALAHIVLNKLNNVIRCCVVKAPGFGDYRRAILEDVAILTKAKLFTNTNGRGLVDATLKDLGTAKTVSVGINSTKIIGTAASSEEIQEVIAGLKERMLDEQIQEHQIMILQERISRLSGGVAIFKVGASSEGELREKKDRVEDAINAVKSALSEGVVPGGGAALLHCLKSLDSLDKANLLPEERTGIMVVKESLKAPFNQILLNAGIEERAELQKKIIERGGFAGFDALKLEFVEDMLVRGIIDPLKVVRSALEHAAAASGILLTTEVLICEDDSEK